MNATSGINSSWLNFRAWFHLYPKCSRHYRGLRHCLEAATEKKTEKKADETPPLYFYACFVGLPK
jgi:hypothetical protein